jgi:prophage regulatory protein
MTNNTQGCVIMTINEIPLNIPPSSGLQALRLRKVQEKTGLCKSAIYAKAKVGQFPAPIKLGGSRTSGWLEHEVDFWLHQQIQASRIGGVV